MHLPVFTVYACGDQLYVCYINKGCPFQVNTQFAVAIYVSCAMSTAESCYFYVLKFWNFIYYLSRPPGSNSQVQLQAPVF